MNMIDYASKTWKELIELKLIKQEEFDTLISLPLFNGEGHEYLGLLEYKIKKRLKKREENDQP